MMQNMGEMMWFMIEIWGVSLLNILKNFGDNLLQFIVVDDKLLEYVEFFMILKDKKLFSFGFVN